MDNDQPIPPVDRGLVALFLEMTVEERLSANDSAVIAIQELRHAFEQGERKEPGS